MIVLVGFMAAGKTTVGRLTAAKLGLPFIDTDELVELRTGATISEIFKTRGEPAFRELEREIALEALNGEDAVVALGGGALADPVIAAALESKDVAYLEVSYREFMRRAGDQSTRPMLQQEDPRALFEARKAVYEGLATVTVSTDGRRPDEIALQIAVAVAGAAVASDLTRRVVVPLGERTYQVVVGRDLLTRLDESLSEMPGAEKAFVLTHPHLAHFAGEIENGLEIRGLRVEHLLLDDGERSKSVDVVSTLWSELARRGAHKRDLLIGMGGGVVCDVAGFVAATYARGLPLIQVPTTLLAQVDAAIGGKCGVNLSSGKNLVGTIYQPRAVICDVDVLASLPREEFRSGMAEVIKYGLITDPELLSGIADTSKRIHDGHSGALIEIVSRCAAIKASYVVADEHDAGRRAHLNYGHTFAHAIERNRRYGTIRHGEAVAVGMMAAAYLSNEMGELSDEGVEVHREALTSAGLPVSMDLHLDDLEEAWQHDKKYAQGVRFVLLREIGRPQFGVKADKESLQAALKRLAG